MHQDDQILRDGCIAGDPEAAERFVVTYSDVVYRGIQSTFKGRGVPYAYDDLQDIHNTVFLQIFDKGGRKLKQFRGENGCRMKTWIRLIAVRTTLNVIRKRGYDGIADQRKAVSFEDMVELQANDPGPWQHLAQKERHRLLSSAMNALPPRERLFVRLHIEKGMSVPDVAEAMQLTVNNAHTVKHRVVKRLKEHVHRISAV